MDFSYRLGEAGWATVLFQQAESHYQFMVSYLSNALEDLTQATNALLAGSDHENIVFMCEPGEHQLLISRIEQDLLIEVRWFDAWASKGMFPLESYEVRFIATVSEQDFVTKVYESLSTILKVHGFDGYRDKWIDHDFPVVAYEKLQRNLELQPS